MYPVDHQQAPNVWAGHCTQLSVKILYLKKNNQMQMIHRVRLLYTL